MERQTIYLDNDEEITSVVDKLKGAEKVSVDLVIPKESVLLQSVVNLKLLKKQAEGLGKEISIVTQDKVGRKLAAQIGIPVIEHAGDEIPVVKMSEAEEIAKESDIEMKEAPATLVTEPEDEIEFKKGAEETIAPTSEKLTPGVEKVESKPEEPKTEEPKGKEKPKGKKWKTWGLVGGFVALFAFVAAYIFIPQARVELKVAAEKNKVDFTFKADKTASSVDAGNQVIPARVIDENVEKSEKYKTTGKKKTGTKATGTITVRDTGFNSPGPTQIIAGTRFVNSGGLIFKSTANISVPGFTVVNGNPVPGAPVSVTVEADQVGDEYNLAPTSFTIPALNTNKITASSASAFSGGTSKDIQFVTQTDLNTAKEDMAKKLEDELKKLALEKTGRDERLLENAWKITQVSAEPSVAVNGEAAEFELKAKSNIKAIVFKDEDLKKLAQNVLRDQIGQTKEILESEQLTASAEFTDGDFEKNQMNCRLSGEAFVGAKLDQDKIKTDISGESEAKAAEYFRQMGGIDEVNIRFFPSFYKRLPRVKNHIYIKSTINKSQE